MTIAAILRDKGGTVFSLTRDMTVRDAVALLTEHRIGAAPVLDAAGAVAGVFSERDVIHRLYDRGAAALDEPVTAVMTAPALCVAPMEPVIGALTLMTRRRVRHLPVVEAREDSGRLVGFVSIGDLVKYRIDRIEADAAAMRDYIQSA